MEQNKLIETFEQRFKEQFPNKRLLAIRLDGFSHTLFYDNPDQHSDGTEEDYELLRHTTAPEQNTQEANKFFADVPHYVYQNNPWYHIWVRYHER